MNDWMIPAITLYVDLKPLDTVALGINPDAQILTTVFLCSVKERQGEGITRVAYVTSVTLFQLCHFLHVTKPKDVCRKISKSKQKLPIMSHNCSDPFI